MIRVLSNYKHFMCRRCKVITLLQRHYTKELENKFSDTQREKILQVINEGNSSLSGYSITKARIKHISDFVKKYGQIKSLSDIESVEGFTEKQAKKLFKSILDGPQKQIENLSKKIKGQILHPTLTESVRQVQYERLTCYTNLKQSCKTVLAVYITVNSVCWALINKEKYEVDEWRYYGIDYPDGKKMQITDILNIAWNITKELPVSDIYVMKAEATSLRAAGSDPNNPKVLGVNLQKAQLVSMIVALVNVRNNISDVDSISEEVNEVNLELKQKVYFLRPTLPFRLYGTLVGNERVSSNQTVENLLQQANSKGSSSHVFVPENFVNMFRNQKELQRDMLGQCLLLALTFMDICIYKNKDSINKLLKRGE